MFRAHVETLKIPYAGHVVDCRVDLMVHLRFKGLLNLHHVHPSWV